MPSKCQVFISYKNLGGDGRPTRDSQLAEYLYHELTRRGLDVFYSNLSLPKLGESAYKKCIDHALDGAQVLFAVGTSTANLESTWVRYEWDSFFNDILSGVKPTAKLFVYYEGMKVQDLPRTLRQQQAFAHAEDQLDAIYNFVMRALPNADVPKFQDLGVCLQCGRQFNQGDPPHCSYHPQPAVLVHHLGARDDYRDVYEFPCCNSVVYAAVAKFADGWRDIAPSLSPGCQRGRCRTR